VNPAATEPNANYRALMQEIVKFFRTGTPSVASSESLEVLAFMEAADISKRRNGAPVTLQEVMEEVK
jgi:hypothetical protein